MPDSGFLLTTPHDPRSPALFDANTSQWLSRAELTSRVESFSARLTFRAKALGFLFPFNDTAGVIGYLACLHAGHAVAMLNPELDPALQSRLIERFQPDFLIAPDTASPPGPLYGAPESPCEGLFLYRSLDPHRHEVHPDLTLLISTSGSTGSPKLVRLSRRNLESNARQINRALGSTDRDRCMITSPVFNAYAQSVIHTMLLCGGGFALTRKALFSREFWDTARTAECNSIGGTPYFYQVLDRLNPDSLNIPLVTKFVQTGGRLPEHLGRKFHGIAHARGGALHIMYGQAEATARISGVPPVCLPDAARSIGFALAGGSLTVALDGVPRAPMQEGELIYEGPNVMMGYATHPGDLALPDQLHGRLATGDLGYRDTNGLFYITGRRSRFVKLNGWRISLDEIEELLSPSGPVAAVNEEERIVVYSEQPLDEPLHDLAARLSIHPSGLELRTIAAIPRLATGKPDYRRLHSPVLTLQ